MPKSSHFETTNIYLVPSPENLLGFIVDETANQMLFQNQVTEMSTQLPSMRSRARMVVFDTSPFLVSKTREVIDPVRVSQVEKIAANVSPSLASAN